MIVSLFSFYLFENTDEERKVDYPIKIKTKVKILFKYTQVAHHCLYDFTVLLAIS